LEEKEKELAEREQRVWHLEGTIANLEYRLEKFGL
jgi:hypothetical protein